MSTIQQRAAYLYMHALRLAGMKRAQNGLKEPQNLAQIFILFAGHSKFTNGAFWSHLFL